MSPSRVLRPAVSTAMTDIKKSDSFGTEMSKLEIGPRGFDRPSSPQVRPAMSSATSLLNHPIVPVLAYCGSSILMTVMNKYVLSGSDFNLNFLLLLVQVGDLSLLLFFMVYID